MNRKPPKKSSLKRHATSSTESVAKLKQTIAAQAQELRQAAEQQTATSEILGMIARSPADLQSVMDAIAENAAQLCDANDVLVHRVDGNALQLVSHFGSIPTVGGSERRLVFDRGSVPGRAIVERQTIHIHDLPAVAAEFPGSVTRGIRLGIRTALATPLMRDGIPLGVIHIRRTEVRPFTDKQIELLKTFADQAVIAIENVRLFQELTEALEQQTATSEVLGVIASSPTDIQPVLNTVAINAARLCEATDAQIRLVEHDGTRLVASFGTAPAPEFVRNTPRNPAGRAILNRETVHVNDIVEAMKSEYLDIPEMQTRRTGTRTFLSTPMLREGIPIGLINIRRTEVRPFSEKQIALLKTFADQAVIAIENVRLFKEIQERNAELREALEHQTATAEVLSIISRSPTEVQPVLDAIVESAAQVCRIDDVVLRLREGTMLAPRAHFGPIPLGRVEIGVDEPQQDWMREHGVLHIPDARAQKDFPMLGSIGGWRTFLGAPLRQKGELVGLLTARRTEVRPFTPAQIKLLETFADQAIIAIENVRLFQELSEALEQQTATSQILGVIASSPTDIQPVLDVVAENAARVVARTTL
jgi:two-component system NtrC family sensor kinase